MEIRDLRPIDWNTGKRVALAPGGGSICSRCGREHVKVYKINDGKREMQVGSTCSKRATGGWEPEAAELRSARRRQRERVEGERKARVAEWVDRLGPSVFGEVPEPQVLGREQDEHGRNIYVWGSPSEPGATVWTAEEGLSPERLESFAHVVRARRIQRIIGHVPKMLGTDVARALQYRRMSKAGDSPECHVDDVGRVLLPGWSCGVAV